MDTFRFNEIKTWFNLNECVDINVTDPEWMGNPIHSLLQQSFLEKYHFNAIKLELNFYDRLHAHRNAHHF